jgi:hypothetical protein
VGAINRRRRICICDICAYLTIGHFFNIERDTKCSNYAQAASAATKISLPIPQKHVFVLLNVLSARHVPKAHSLAIARTVGVSFCLVLDAPHSSWPSSLHQPNGLLSCEAAKRQHEFIHSHICHRPNMLFKGTSIRFAACRPLTPALGLFRDRQMHCREI